MVKLCALPVLLCTSLSLMAADFTVIDAKGAPLKNIVIEIYAGQLAKSSGTPAAAQMSQRDRQFKPGILAVQQNAPVTFPNYDDIAHHIYSFSPAKTFEKELYKGTNDSPVIFDKPGVVELGCNVHDWMMGYIYVAASSNFAMTNEKGVATLPAIGKGEYQLKLWHPLMADSEQITRSVVLTSGNHELKLNTLLAAGDDFDIDELGAY